MFISKISPVIRLAAIALGLSQIALASPALAQSSDPDRLRAAIVFNVLRFVEFPSSTGETIDFCVASDYRAGRAFRSFSGRRAGDRTVSVRTVNSGSYSGCEVVYLSSSNRQQISRASARGRVVMGDGRSFIDNGGTVGLVQTGNQVRFQINLRTASANEVTFSSRLIRLASRVNR